MEIRLIVVLMFLVASPPVKLAGNGIDRVRQPLFPLLKVVGCGPVGVIFEPSCGLLHGI